LRCFFLFLLRAMVDQGIGNSDLDFVTLVLVAQLNFYDYSDVCFFNPKLDNVKYEHTYKYYSYF
jgi:hypothetical protein